MLSELDEFNFNIGLQHKPGYLYTFLEFISKDPFDSRVRTRTVYVKNSDADRTTMFFSRRRPKNGSLPYLEPGEFEEFLKNGLNPNKDKIINTIKNILHGRIVIRSREDAIREV